MKKYDKHNCELANESTCEEDIDADSEESYDQAVAEEFGDEI